MPAVLDGGPEISSDVFLERAEEWFTRAITLGAGAGVPEISMAARAGRASVRAQLGNWAGAVSDANQVPDDFVFNMDYTTQEDSQFNRIYWAGANQPYRAHTVWNTFYENYFTETGDPRTPWGQNPDIPRGDAAIAFLEGVQPGSRAPWYFQLKHDQRDSPHALSTGWEMRLTEAEALLRDGNWQAALPLINKHRVELGLDAWEATSLNEAWTVYKRERGIELWLEGRRMADLRRWDETNAPGDLHPLESAGTSSDPEPPSFLGGQPVSLLPDSQGGVRDQPEPDPARRGLSPGGDRVVLGCTPRTARSTFRLRSGGCYGTETRRGGEAQASPPLLVSIFRRTADGGLDRRPTKEWVAPPIRRGAGTSGRRGVRRSSISPPVSGRESPPPSCREAAMAIPRRPPPSPPRRAPVFRLSRCRSSTLDHLPQGHVSPAG